MELPSQAGTASMMAAELESAEQSVQLTTAARSLRIGVDASNLRRGGGITHLSELLRAAEPKRWGITRVIVWGARATLERLEPRPWLELVGCPLLEGGATGRAMWRRCELDRLATHAADLLFVPGGSYSGRFRPFVTMSRNMLPFDREAAARYGFSRMGLRIQLLRRLQAATFRRADGVIFLMRTAQEAVQAVSGPLRGRTCVVPHGVSARFAAAPNPQRPLAEYSSERPFRWLYVSIVDVYKHQGVVAEAVAALHREGMPVHLDLVGPAYAPALRELRSILERVDPCGQVISYRGSIDYSQLHRIYGESDAFVFASSCENMPNILLEAMAAGLPVACSDRGVMPELLGEGGVLFDPLRPDSVAAAMRLLMMDPMLRARLAEAAHLRARAYTWQRCAQDTFSFLADIAAAPAAAAAPV